VIAIAVGDNTEENVVTEYASGTMLERPDVLIYPADPRPAIVLVKGGIGLELPTVVDTRYPVDR
jgi:hypothetical protein